MTKTTGTGVQWMGAEDIKNKEAPASTQYQQVL